MEPRRTVALVTTEILAEKETPEQTGTLAQVRLLVTPAMRGILGWLATPETPERLLLSGLFPTSLGELAARLETAALQATLAMRATRATMVRVETAATVAYRGIRAIPAIRATGPVQAVVVVEAEVPRTARQVTLETRVLLPWVEETQRPTVTVVPVLQELRLSPRAVLPETPVRLEAREPTAIPALALARVVPVTRAILGRMETPATQGQAVEPETLEPLRIRLRTTATTTTLQGIRFTP